MEKARILIYDLEVSRDIVEGYGNKWEFKVVKTIRHQELMCYAYKWLGDKKVHYVSKHDFDNTKDFVQSLADLQNEAHIVIAHNANKFDNKMANRFFLKYGINPPSPYKTIDTLRVARANFKFQSNSLNDLGEFMEVGSKSNITYADLETEFMSDNCSDKCERLMKKYNVQDVVLLEKIYLKLRPFIRNHPNVGDITMLNGVCPKCGSSNIKKEGTHARRNGRVQSYSCNDCHGWCNESSIKHKGRIVNF